MLWGAQVMNLPKNVNEEKELFFKYLAPYDMTLLGKQFG